MDIKLGTAIVSEAFVPLRMKSAPGRWTLLATILGSAMASLDSTVVNIALPRIGQDLGGGLEALQWTVNAYTLTLAAFLLLGGSLGDRLGHRRVFLVGVVWFALASLVCAVAPTSGLLIGARALQGIGAALLTPGSLAILEASFVEDDRAAAIGAWSGFAGIAIAIGPFLGGWLIECVSWRLIFLINAPIAVVVLRIGVRHIPETKNESKTDKMDFGGACAAVIALSGSTYALTRGLTSGWADGAVVFSGLIGIAAIGVFLLLERRSSNPILPLTLFHSTQFSAANAVTFLVYGALGCTLFLLPIVLQQVLHYSPIAAGSCLLPITVIMLLLSSRMGRLASRIGPRIPMTVGPIVSGAGVLFLSHLENGSALAVVLVGTSVLALGLATTVAPLTATVLASAPPERAGVASAVNTDVARIAQLVFVIVIPFAAGLTNESLGHAVALSEGFHKAMTIASLVLGVGGLLAFVKVREPMTHSEWRASAPSKCAIDAP